MRPPDHHYDFFLSRRGSVATVAWEVEDEFRERGTMCPFRR